MLREAGTGLRRAQKYCRHAIRPKASRKVQEGGLPGGQELLGTLLASPTRCRLATYATPSGRVTANLWLLLGVSNN